MVQTQELLPRTQPAQVAPSESLFDLAEILWRRKGIGLVVVAACLALGAIYYARAQRVYQSTAQILLIKKEKVPFSGTETDRKPGRYSEYGYEDTVSTHMILICSPMIVRKAVESHRLDGLPSLKSDDGAGPDNPVPGVVRRIILRLTASRAGDKSAPDPNVMNLSFQGPNPDDCEAVLTAIIDSYQKFLGETYQNYSAETVQLITQAREGLSRQLTEKENAYTKFRQETLPVISQGPGQQPITIADQRVLEIDRARSDVVLEMSKTRSFMEGVRAAVGRKANREAIALLIRNSQRSVSSPSDLRGQLEMVLLENMMSEQEAIEAYGPDHPKVKIARKKMATLRERLSGETVPEGSGSAEFIKIYIESLAEELKLGEHRVQELDKLFEKEWQASKRLMASQYAGENMRSDLARTQQLFDAVIKRLEEINLAKDYGGITMQLLSEPEEGIVVRPKVLTVFALTLLAGFGLGVGMVYLAEIADRSFRSPDDVRSQLKLPVFGHIPVMPADADKDKIAATGDGEAKPTVHPRLCTFHHPKGRPAEAYRAVRTALYFGTEGQSHKVIQVTSPGPGDGKTTLAANLAISIADSGKRTLLVDADFRRPKVGKYFGIDGEAGLGSLFAGDVDLPDIVQKTVVENLWAIPCGPRPDNPADLLTSGRFKDFIEVVREQYDFVIVDSPPVLAVTDPSAIAPRVDGIVFVLRLSKHARDAASRAIEVLNNVGGRILGLVVNGVGDRQGYGYGKYGYRYSHYRYGGYGKRGYGYGYGAYGDPGYGYQDGSEDNLGGEDADDLDDSPKIAADSNNGKPKSAQGTGPA